MKRNILIIFWLFLAISGNLYAQTIFLEDFNEGSTFPEGWEVNTFPVYTHHSYVSAYKVARSNWCLGEGNEFNLYYYGEEDYKHQSQWRLEIVSPVLDLAAFEQLNFSTDFYRQEFDRINSELPIILYLKNSQMEEWEEFYVHVYGELGRRWSVPFICSLDSAIFRKDGFQFMLVIDLKETYYSYSHKWFNLDNIRIEEPEQTDLAIFDDYPKLHIPQDSLLRPKVRIVNKGIDPTNGKIHCYIREHKSNELVYEETVDIAETGRMDTLSLFFPAFDMPYSNHLYHLTYELECVGDENLANNLINYDVDTYTTSFQNWPGLNILYSTEYSVGDFDWWRPDILLENLDTLNRIKEILSKVSVVNYIYDDVADSLDCQTTVAFMNDLGITYAPTKMIHDKDAYLPRFSLYPRRVFRPFEVFWSYGGYPCMFDFYRKIAEYRSPFTLDIYGTHSGLDYNIMVELTPKAPIINDRLKLRTVITRSHVPSNANPDIYEGYRVEFFDDVVQMALPDTNGIAFAMDGSETSAKQWEMSFSLKDFWDPEQVKIVTYVQDTFTYDILQCRAVPLQNLWGVGMEEEPQTPAESVLISPNPAKDVLYAQVMLEMPANMDFRLFDINGRDLGILKRSFLGAGNHKVQISVPKHIKTGIYILQTETEREVYSQKLNIVR